MKKMILTLVITLIGVVAYSQNVVYVKGYTKKNGTYVEGHYRTKANNTVMDNFSTYPNVNPYTGEIGTKHITDNYYNTINVDYVIEKYSISNYNNYNPPSSSYQINSLMQTNPINYTNDLFKTNSLFR